MRLAWICFWWPRIQTLAAACIWFSWVKRFVPSTLNQFLNLPLYARNKGIPIAPIADLVRMKLTSFRLKDKVHIQDLDGVGLITPEIEQSLSEPLRQRLAEVRATE